MALWPGPAMTAAAKPVALVVDIVGDSEPRIEAFTELVAGAKIDLGKSTRIEFLDYNSCKNVTAVGGILHFTERRYTLRKGKVIDAKRARCPKVTVLKTDARLGGVLLRGAKSGLKVKARPHFVIAGDSRDKFNRLRVLKGEAEILSTEIKGYRFEWPEGAADLAPGQDYALEFLAAGQEGAKTLPFEVTTGRGAAAVTVIRLE